MGPTILPRLRVLACGVLLGLSAAGVDAAAGIVVLPGQYTQTRLAGVSGEHRIGPEHRLPGVPPRAAGPGGGYPQRFARARELTAVDAIDAAAAADFATGGGAAGGGFAPPGRARLDARTADPSITVASGSAGYARTADGLSWTTDVTLTVRPPDPDRGARVLASFVGRTYHLRQRTCTRVPGGGTGNDWCGGWVDATMAVPTGVRFRYPG